MLKVEIDPGSGFCGGVIRAISQAETFLSKGTPLYSLGDIVHNEAELTRLRESGLITVNSLSEVPEGQTVLIRAHGEPPQTYREADARHLDIIDCSCPVVLQLQRSIRAAYLRLHADGAHGQVLIFGRIGHAEVLGLLGQVNGDALVIENGPMLQDCIEAGELDFTQPMEIFSQTTKSPSEYSYICRKLKDSGAQLTVHDTICNQVAGRYEQLSNFAAAHDVIVFVAGRTSSNGAVLSELCATVNPRTYRAGSRQDLNPAWFRPGDRVGVCGATSTPQWLLEDVAGALRRLQNELT